MATVTVIEDLNVGRRNCTGCRRALRDGQVVYMVRSGMMSGFIHAQCFKGPRVDDLPRTTRRAK